MKALHFKICLLSFSVFLVHCEFGGDPISVNEMFFSQDCTVRIIKNGIFLKIEDIQDSYSLQDIISGRMLLINENNPKGLDIYVPSSPPIGGFQIFNQNDQLQYFYPSIVGCAVFSMTLLPGDTLHVKTRWAQNGAYAGRYKIVGQFYGNILLYYNKLVKWIEITEEGDPISSVALRHYGVEDSIKISFIIRNRISVKQIFNLKGKYPFSYFFVSKYSTVDTMMHKKFEQVLNLEDKLIMNPKSDTNIYCFKISKNDPELSELSGQYYVTFLLKCEEREIKSSVVLNFIL